MKKCEGRTQEHECKIDNQAVLFPATVPRLFVSILPRSIELISNRSVVVPTNQSSVLKYSCVTWPSQPIEIGWDTERCSTYRRSSIRRRLDLENINGKFSYIWNLFGKIEIKSNSLLYIHVNISVGHSRVKEWPVASGQYNQFTKLARKRRLTDWCWIVILVIVGVAQSSIE